MLEPDVAPIPAPRRPRTLSVLGVILAAAIAVSYLTAFAGANALVAAHVLQPLPRDHDPRPRWMFATLAILLTIFLAISISFRRASRREMQSIDAMADAPEGSG